jgi:hypothetical protein
MEHPEKVQVLNLAGYTNDEEWNTYTNGEFKIALGDILFHWEYVRVFYKL